MKKFLVLCAILLLGFSAAGPARAALSVDVTQGNPQPLPIAIPDFLPGTPADAQVGTNIASVVRADLDPAEDARFVYDLVKDWLQRQLTAEELPAPAEAERSARRLERFVVAAIGGTMS